MYRTFSTTLGTAILMVAAAVTAACDSDDPVERSAMLDGGGVVAVSDQGDVSADGAVSASDASEANAGSGGRSAILVGVFVRNPDGRNVYVGAVPEVPSGELDYSRFLEFGDVEASTHGGYVFVWDRDPATMTRLSVGDDLQLTPGPTLSFLEQGLSGTARTVYISATRAYTLSPALDRIVVWDPSAMTITGTIEMTPPVRAPGLETSAAEGHLAGNSVIWPLVSTNWDGEKHFQGTAVAIVDAHTGGPVRIVEDQRCVGADGAHVDEKGDFYLRAGGYWGSAAAYGPQATTTRTCVVRINAGESVFDPNYLVDMKALTGTYVNLPWFHVEGSKYLAQPWDPAVPVPASIDDYWDGAGAKPMLVDIATGESQPYPHVAGHTVVSRAEFKLDGTSYYQLSQTGSAVNGSATVVELHPEGIVRRFTLPELWALDRIR